MNAPVQFESVSIFNVNLSTKLKIATSHDKHIFNLLQIRLIECFNFMIHFLRSTKMNTLSHEKMLQPQAKF